ncbi:hypothetical protein LAZ67_11001155 [Cordylochernes scorpioides]|uniref:Uncharacterized protein n=1 Tax=Cordylochernes scorpioides TaxID=51811 RepID=A0ABY6KYA7_9ARAC|nr:hypothetical protein LAZ67_11001155 [Cordylochernes scorpioides]
MPHCIHPTRYNNYITTESRQDLPRTTQRGWNLENRATPEFTTLPPTATDIVGQLAEPIQDITASSLSNNNHVSDTMELTRESLRAMNFYDYKSNLTSKESYERLMEALGDKATTIELFLIGFMNLNLENPTLKMNLLGRPPRAVTQKIKLSWQIKGCFSIITVDETRNHNFNPETKRQSTLCCSSKSPPPKKVRRARSVKQMVACFFFI